ncbi:hypothetical protein [Variovorax guangxiensis]|uniref:hypothetical protein n=1 Tax=Variovorax guangxiensis TaxID=1775474 RepID=UPI00286398D9|nr:hypothetical protein [Variovorax guangxiensis]MDR6855313.1 hypothetical protein [Variovorax guangxiensis]
MWIFLPGGSFVSVVEKASDVARDTLTVRARAASDLSELRAFLPSMPPIERGGGTDYAVRVVVPRAEFAAALGRMAGAIKYANFKDRVAETRGTGRARVLNTVWTIIRRLQA